MQKTSLKEAVVTQNYNAVDLMRFLFALTVCSIHVRIGDDHSSAFFKMLDFLMGNWAGRLAVPFFFIAAGFFLFRSMELYAPDMSRIKNYCFKLLRLCGIWFTLLITSSKLHLWYLGSTVSAVILLALLLRRGVRLRYLFILAGGLYAIGLLGQTYVALIEPLAGIRVANWIAEAYVFFFESTRNGFFTGFIFVLIGAALAKHPLRMKMSVAWIAFAGSLLALLAEAIAVKKLWDVVFPNVYIFLPIAGFLLFYIVSNIKLKDRPIYRKLRDVSVLVYFLHFFVARIFMKIFHDFSFPFCPYIYFVSVAATVLLSFGILKLTKKISWLRYLYS